MKIALGSDHAGFAYKEKIKVMLLAMGHDVKDFGTFTPDMVDYPLFIRPAAEAVANGACDRGIVLGGSGNGEAMVANKVRGVRCALCWNEATAKAAREHNDANVLSLGERMIPEATALDVVRIFLETPFDPAGGGGRHARRIAMIE
jgi:ribose 5-phosphate isomerase B